MALAENSKLHQIAIIVSKKDIEYMKKHGFNRSKFVRQAVKSHKNKEWKYDFME